MTDHSAPVLAVEKLTKRYGEFTALDAVSFNVPRGAILGLIGPNGAGKTTAIKILVGLARATGGSATIGGVDCGKDTRKIKRLVGYMPDRFGSFDNMRVREYLDFFGAAFGIGRRKRAKRIDEVLETTNAGYMRDRFVETLSHGMQQRVGIARTLLHDPDVLILDEPANGLDPQARIEMRELLLQLAGMGKTLLVTSHILPELSRICDRVAILLHGKLRAFGTLDEIMHTISQKRTIEIQLASNDHLETAVDAVRDFVEADSEVQGSPTESIVRTQTAQTEEELGRLLTKLVQNGVDVTQFRELQTDLEDAFLSVTQRENTDATADAEAADSTPAMAETSR